MDQPLLVATRATAGGNVRVLTMYRPAARNAMDSALLAALIDALDAADQEPGLSGLLLTGGAQAFSAGADLKEGADGLRRRMELFTHFYDQLTGLRLPTAAAVEGPAVGGGAEAAAACDFRVAGGGAHFRFPGAVYGVPVGVARTVGQVGLSTAKDWVLSGRDVSAAEAHRAGFVQQLVPDGDAEAVALDWLARVGSRDAATVALLKQMFNAQSGLRDRVAYENDALRAFAETGTLPQLDRGLPRTVRPRRR